MRVILLFLFLSLQAIGQLSAKNRYSDKLEPGSKLVKSGSNFTVERTISGTFIYKQYFYETRQLTIYITCRDKKLKIKDGIYREWYDDGTLWQEGQFENNFKNGNWFTDYYKSHVVTCNYYNGKRNGESLTRDTAGNIIAKGNYVDGKLEREYDHYNAKGELTKRCIYKDDKIIQTILNDSTYNAVDHVAEKMPAFPGCEDIISEQEEIYQKCAEGKLLVFLKSHTAYPGFAREKEITGTCYVTFRISKEGKVKDIRVLRGLCNDIMQQCLEVVNKMPDWHPGMQNNKPVEVSYNLPFKFTLK